MDKKYRPRLIILGWISLGVLGIFLLLIGLSSFVYELFTNYRMGIKIIFSIIGITLIVFSIKKSFFEIINGVKKNGLNGNINRNDISNMIYRERVLSKGPKVVVIGGGTGLSVLLRGLKESTSNITAIVTVADDGGGSGILREDLGMLPPGDIRSCILALANTEPTMEKLLQYRFDEGLLKGQNFGNLFIAAMNEIYGSFEMAIKETSNVLAVTGKVLPMTLEDVTLYAVLENGHTIKGESEIPLKNKELSSRIKRIYMEPMVSYPLTEAVEAIEDADLIVLGPGSLYTSVIPNLLVNNIVDTIYRAEGPKVYITNVMTQPGETDSYTVLDHVEGIVTHSREDFLDYVIVNIEEIPKETLTKYASDGSEPVILGGDDEEILNSKGIQVIKGNLIDIKKDYIRHDSIELSKMLIDIAKNKVSKIQI
ncbi:gluconeogenesis factor YvcK family protein [Schnuerera ultunensis]|uniref:gluconeogenesis factor YvcK family protein n=1 Tax=Schnuerera ultunensis TaxID=45497 RepID=UPI000412D5D2|nr:YvcK family protein [Schnuerera ultunensis]